MKKSKINVGTIQGNDLLLNREGKLSKADRVVTRGCGVHVPKNLKEKHKQKLKRELTEYY
ncbi:hypothetical protein [Clostridium cylindrosporum]|uniref:Uncharacterized protein n=1 Tax=Clostridium cylindrosporum DSM 605 TaxID=1121307 RepID=A0A0J8G1X8_CLOCY|nr:hypothetical protein [Clostridium cylindrosporum]KMT21766.1 hypothetical protein CLCY_3c00330 [Clostridium cylindrosporum DSM 605]